MQAVNHCNWHLFDDYFGIYLTKKPDKLGFVGRRNDQISTFAESQSDSVERSRRRAENGPRVGNFLDVHDVESGAEYETAFDVKHLAVDNIANAEKWNQAQGGSQGQYGRCDYQVCRAVGELQ